MSIVTAERPALYVTKATVESEVVTERKVQAKVLSQKVADSGSFLVLQRRRTVVVTLISLLLDHLDLVLRDLSYCHLHRCQRTRLPSSIRSNDDSISFLPVLLGRTEHMIPAHAGADLVGELT